MLEPAGLLVHSRNLAVLNDALPQIVAVVKAAERADDQFFNTPERYVGTAMSNLAAAIAALEQALTNPQGKD